MRITQQRASGLALALAGALTACGGGSAGGATAAPFETTPVAAAPTAQELQCQALGWQRGVVTVAGLARLMLWKAPAGNAWSRGAMVVMHGGGGTHTNFCIANVALTGPQVRFTDMALVQGFAVFLLDSSDRVTDNAGRLCGKVWDDEPRSRANLDLPFIEQVLRTEIPARRPGGSRSEIFITGHSSGGYMATRAASSLGGLISAFAPVSSGDPYGWHRDCTPLPGDRVNVFGVGLDNDSGQNISVPNACAGNDAGERSWDVAVGSSRPPWRQFHHQHDGINDLSCVQRARRQLLARGFPEQAPFTLTSGARSVDVHYWLDDYNQPLLSYFAGRL